MRVVKPGLLQGSSWAYCVGLHSDGTCWLSSMSCLIVDSRRDGLSCVRRQRWGASNIEGTTPLLHKEQYVRFDYELRALRKAVSAFPSCALEESERAGRQPRRVEDATKSMWPRPCTRGALP